VTFGTERSRAGPPARSEAAHQPDPLRAEPGEHRRRRRAGAGGDDGL